MAADCSRISLNPDWGLHLAFHNMARRALLDHGEVPLWSPHFGGGFPVYGHPENPLPSPFVLPTLLLGEVAGLKVAAVLYWLVGAWGVYLLGRVFGCDPWGAATAGAVVALSSWVPQRMLSGNHNELNFLLYPLVLALYRLSVTRRRALYGVGAALVLAVALIDGKTCNLVLGLMLLAAAAAATFARRQGGPRVNWRPGLVLAAVLAGAALLAMVKVAPIVTTTWPFLTGHETPYHHAYAWTSPGHSVGSVLAQFVLLERRGGVGSLRFAYCCIGWAPALVLVAASVLAWRRVWLWAAALAALVTVMMGADSPVDLFQLIRRLPGYRLILGPAKYFSFPAVLCAAMVCGLGVTHLLPRLRSRPAKALAAALALAAVLQLQWNAWHVLRQVFTVRLPRAPRREAFFQVRRSDDTCRSVRTARSDQYLNLLRNVGTIDWNSAFLLPENPVPRYFVDPGNRVRPNPAYRGEAWLEGAGRAVMRRVTANRLEVYVGGVTQTPVRLVVNQNYHPGWRCRWGKVEPYQGLLSVLFRHEGDARVMFYFRPESFCFGGMVSLVTLLVVAVWCGWDIWRRPPATAMPTSGDVS